PNTPFAHHFVHHFVFHFVEKWAAFDKVVDKVKDKVLKSHTFGQALTRIFHTPDAGWGHPAYNDDGLVPVGRAPPPGALLRFQSRREICKLTELPAGI